MIHVIISKQYTENHMKNPTFIPIKKKKKPAGYRRDLPQFKKGIYKKPTANIIHIAERHCAFTQDQQ